MALLQEALLAKLAENTVAKFGSLLATAKVVPLVDHEKAEAAHAAHLAYLRSWSSEIAHADLASSRPLAEVWVEPEFLDRPDSTQRISLDLISSLATGKHLVLLGPPGAGKTTILKSICRRLLEPPDSAGDVYSFPVLIRLQDVSQTQSVHQLVLSTLGLALVLEQRGATKLDSSHEDLRPLTESIVSELLNAQRTVLLLDGFDEVNPAVLTAVEQQIRLLANQLRGAALIVTARTSSFHAALENSRRLHVAPLSDTSRCVLANNWFGSSDRAANFLTALRGAPYYDSSGRPLTLVHLCMLYDAYGELPDQPATIYSRIVDLLLKEWDREKGVRRVSRYARFGSEDKKRFLAALSWELVSNAPGRSTFDKPSIERAFDRISKRFGLVEAGADDVIAEIESHNGLFLRLGFYFQFAHKSLQEYLCGDYISRSPDASELLQFLSRLPHECAIATVLSAEPARFLALLTESIQDAQFWLSFLSRLDLEGARFEDDRVVGVSLLKVASLAWTRGPVSGRFDLSDGLEEALNRLISRAQLRGSFRKVAGLITDKKRLERCTEFRFLEPAQRWPVTLVVSNSFIDLATDG